MSVKSIGMALCRAYKSTIKPAMHDSSVYTFFRGLRLKRRTFMKSCATGALAVWADGWLVGQVLDTHELEMEFRNPPSSAGPHNWWHWMNGNISEIGITRDIEAMKRVGV